MYPKARQSTIKLPCGTRNADADTTSEALAAKHDCLCPDPSSLVVFKLKFTAPWSATSFNNIVLTLAQTNERIPVVQNQSSYSTEYLSNLQTRENSAISGLSEAQLSKSRLGVGAASVLEILSR